MRKVLHIVLVSVFLYGGLVSAAPLMFCRMDACMESSVPDCCASRSTITDNCCAESGDAYCPICSQNLCQSEPSPQVVSSVRIDRTDDIIIIAAAATDHYSVPTVAYAAANSTDDVSSSPPLWLRDRSLRL